TVGIPVLPLLFEVVHVDEWYARLDQPPGDQQVLTAHVTGVTVLGPVGAALRDRRVDAVALARRDIFFAQVERSGDSLRTGQPIGLLVKLVDAGRRFRIERRSALQSRLQIAPLADPMRRKFLTQGKFGYGVLLPVRIGRDSKRIECRAEEPA